MFQHSWRLFVLNRDQTETKQTPKGIISESKGVRMLFHNSEFSKVVEDNLVYLYLEGSYGIFKDWILKLSLLCYIFNHNI